MVAYFVLIGISAMTRHLVKTSIVIVVSCVLLYYGIAWAVLRCCHDDTRSHQELALYNVDGDIKSLPNGVDANIECVNPVYHTEWMTESPSPSRLDRLTPDATPHINDFSTLTTTKGYRASDLYLRAVFDGASPFDSPRYLSLSILRI